jgi:hypothetical protein
MKTYQNQEMHLDLHPLLAVRSLPGRLGGTIANVEYRNCRLNCSIGSFNRHARPVIRNVKLVDCAMGGSFNGAIIEEVLIDGLRTGKWLASYGSVFQHVTLRGKIGSIMTRSIFHALEDANSPINRFYAEANAAYYAGVDWALDIREAEFIEADLDGVPGHLVRRDPATQFLLTREKALQGAWRDVDLAETYWPTAIETFLNTGLPSEILVAPKRVSSFSKLLDGLKKLRDAGVLEPD